MTLNAPDLLILTDTTPTGTMLRVAGEVDLSSAPQLRDAALRALRQGEGPLCLDLSGVTFLDSTGLHVLIATRRRAQLEGRQLILGDCSRPVERVLQITATATLFPRLSADPSLAATS